MTIDIHKGERQLYSHAVLVFPYCYCILDDQIWLWLTYGGVKCVTKDLDNLVTNMTFNEYEWVQQ